MKRTLWISFMDSNTASHAFGRLFFNVMPWTDGARIKQHDVMIFSGGADINPEIYGEERGAFTGMPQKYKDERERVAFRHAQAAGAACLGICRGAQLLCALSGGKLIQHVTGHGREHNIITKDGGQMKSSSTHHQMMYPFDIPNFELIAYACTVRPENKHFCEYGKQVPKELHGWVKEPEIVWLPDTRSLCIQGHPEEPYMREDQHFPQYCQQLVQQYIFTAKGK